jgi:hypothetical protein
METPSERVLLSFQGKNTCEGKTPCEKITPVQKNYFRILSNEIYCIKNYKII